MPGDKIEEIVDAVLYLFSTRGYLKTTMNDVAAEVDMTKGGIYHYVGKKEDLLLLIHNRMTDAFLRRFREAGGRNVDPRLKLEEWIKAHLSLMRDYQHHIKIFFTELTNLENKESFEQMVSKRDEIFALLYGIIKDGVKKKVFTSQIHPKILTYLIFGMLNWFYHWYKPEGPRNLEKIIEDVNKLLFRGLLAPASDRGGT